GRARLAGVVGRRRRGLGRWLAALRSVLAALRSGLGLGGLGRPLAARLLGSLAARLFGSLAARLLGPGEHLVGEAEVAHLADLLGLALGGRRLAGRPQGQLLVLHALGAQAEAAALGVDLQDLDPDDVALADHLARVLHVVLREL